jgi:hypothetical protein
MKTYIGVKIIQAEPQERFGTHGGDEPGYKVIYEGGYASWSPKETFEKAYRPIAEGCMTFGLAIEALKLGHRVRRVGWNGKGMFIFLVPGSVFKVNRPPLLGIYPEGTEIHYHSHVDLRNADGIIVPWNPSQTDMLAEDWEIVE